uniref:Uncharacterized protein n=1 Tax=Anopheles maculatus TaxID=74869 RepID=A0A182SCM7_9DIPT
MVPHHHRLDRAPSSFTSAALVAMELVRIPKRYRHNSCLERAMFDDGAFGTPAGCFTQGCNTLLLPGSLWCECTQAHTATPMPGMPGQWNESEREREIEQCFGSIFFSPQFFAVASRRMWYARLIISDFFVAFYQR